MTPASVGLPRHSVSYVAQPPRDSVAAVPGGEGIQHVRGQVSARESVVEGLGSQSMHQPAPAAGGALESASLMRLTMGPGGQAAGMAVHRQVVPTGSLTDAVRTQLTHIKGVLAATLGDLTAAVCGFGSAVSRLFSRPAPGTRENYFHQIGGENNNIHTVIHTAAVSEASIGFKEQEFFQQLGDARHEVHEFEDVSSGQLAAVASRHRALMQENAGAPTLLAHNEHMFKASVDGLCRRAEQEYLLQHMSKGAMHAAAQIAERHGTGIAVRGTGLLAHMGIESGMPTKAQEFKNKTSKEVDLWLCEELHWKDVGTVVHYDPRVGWSSQAAAAHAGEPGSRRISGGGAEAISKPTEQDFQNKLTWVREHREGALRTELGPRFTSMPSEAELRKSFFARAAEYQAEDHHYRHGQFAEHAVLEGPCLRLRARPEENLVGDHDLFAFTEKDGGIAKENTRAQRALQSSDAFQAQHGAIAYWEPEVQFEKSIKQTIMGAHSNSGDEPLIHIQPGNRVSAAFYDADSNSLKSVWDSPSSSKWLEKTHSGTLLQKLFDERAAGA